MSSLLLVKIKAKLFPFFIKQALLHEGVWGNEGTALFVLDLCSSWR
jgi:hypothetical protein